MTHDELLKKIDEHYDYGHDTDVLTNALYAVVELAFQPMPESNDDEFYEVWNFAMKKVIQAIERQLK